MLALCYGAAHPEPAVPLVLVGCGTFDVAARQRYRELKAERTPPPLRDRLAELAARLGTEPAAAEEYCRLAEPLDHVAPWPSEPDPDAPGFDAVAHGQTWEDALRTQASGQYPAAFAAIRAPVLMLHGDYDPHPGTMIRDGLRWTIPHLEYLELPRCGHEPWREQEAREAFLEAVKRWLGKLC